LTPLARNKTSLIIVCSYLLLRVEIGFWDLKVQNTSMKNWKVATVPCHMINRMKWNCPEDKDKWQMTDTFNYLQVTTAELELRDHPVNEDQ